MIRSLFAIILTLTFTFTNFVSPVFAYTESVIPDYVYTEAASSSFWDGFLGGLGAALGGAAGTVVACYAVDVLIAPVAPPVAT